MERIKTNDEFLKVIKQSLEETFQKCRLNFTEVDFGDDDLNYFIDFNASDLVSGIGKLSAFIYLTTDKPKCTLMVGNIFKFSKQNEKDCLKIANSINQRLNTGKVIVSDEPKQLLFIDGRVLDNFKQVDDELINSMVFSAKVAIAIIYSDIEGMVNEK